MALPTCHTKSISSAWTLGSRPEPAVARRAPRASARWWAGIVVAWVVRERAQGGECSGSYKHVMAKTSHRVGGGSGERVPLPLLNFLFENK